MPRIELNTEIKAELDVVFDLSRSVDLHIISTEHTNETAIAGKTSGLMALNDEVTWRAKHLGIYQKLTSKITEFNQPHYFVDEMLNGAFKRFRHEHHFSQLGEVTLMTDIFEFESPIGILGRIADRMFLKKYMVNLLLKRNQTIKEYAETKNRLLI